MTGRSEQQPVKMGNQISQVEIQLWKRVYRGTIIWEKMFFSKFDWDDDVISLEI